MRRFIDRIRDESAGVLRRELVGVQNTMETSWNAALDDLRHEMNEQRDTAQARELLERHDLGTVLDRLASAVEGFTEGLDAERRERLVQIELVECLLREVTVGLAPPAPARATVVGGSIDPHLLDSESVQSGIDLREHENHAADGDLTAGVPVEVRSHLNDRWSHGFRISEVLQDSSGRRFKLTRSDGSSIPLSFDAADVRRQLATRA